MDLGGNSECFGCGRSGHWIKNCPNSGSSRGRRTGTRGRGKGKKHFFSCFKKVFCILLIFMLLQICSAIGVETKDTLPGTVNKLKTVGVLYSV